jgi:RHS repeat-associated protein
LYCGFGGDTVGMRVDGVLSWIFGDQLGSTGITYLADGSGTVRQFYYPFGGIRNPGGGPVVDTDVGFTGQRLDETTGLMFYQARYYDPVTARFISADTMIPGPGNPQDFNRYSYVRNNPVGYTDPSGNCATRNGTIIDDASSDPCSPPGVRWVSLAEGIGGAGDGMPTCSMVPGLYQCTIDSNPGDPSLGYLIFGLIELAFNLSPLGVLTDIAECSEGNKVSCGFVGLEFFSGLGPLKRLLKNFKYADEFFDAGRAADRIADSSSAARRAVGWSNDVRNGARLATDDALDAAEDFLGQGYRDLGDGRFKSVDGTRQVRMGELDITGQHGGGPHMNFERLLPDPLRPGRFRIVENRHIFLIEE